MWEDHVICPATKWTCEANTTFMCYIGSYIILMYVQIRFKSQLWSLVAKDKIFPLNIWCKPVQLCGVSYHAMSSNPITALDLCLVNVNKLVSVKIYFALQILWKITMVLSTLLSVSDGRVILLAFITEATLKMEETHNYRLHYNSVVLQIIRFLIFWFHCGKSLVM